MGNDMADPRASRRGTASQKAFPRLPQAAQRGARVVPGPGSAAPVHSIEDETPAAAEKVEIALRERIKELECMYAISSFREQHAESADRFLQAVVDYLPRAFYHPERACARIVHESRSYISERFSEGPWRMSFDVRSDGKTMGRVEVFYSKGVPTSAEGPFLKEEFLLMRTVAERVGSTLAHIKAETELRETHEILRGQHQALQDTHTTLRTVLHRLEEEKSEIRTSIVANIQKIIMPIVFELELAVTGRQRSYVTLLRQSLQEIASPFLSELARSNLNLTPVEVAISTMIRNGLSTKEIAQLRSISIATVRRHRENILRKLGLRNQKRNLVTYLQSSGHRDGEAAAPAAAALTGSAADAARAGGLRGAW
jgi:DNA-binding NarL/FixJ family response regulator